MDQPPPSIPDGFEVVQRLGAGQTAVVWLARTTSGGPKVALKLPRPETGGDLVLRRMFENEVQITLKLDHPNVVRAYDGRPTGAGAFLALEYCGGGTLDQLLLERGRLPLDRALAMVRDVALGLEHAHAQRVLHRDVKPANVFLSEEGVAKLGDFGTGTFAAEDAQERVGTAFYMAPEIFGGAPSSMQSDIYSLGVLAYEVLAGVRPFLGESYDALMVAHMTALPRDLRQARPDLPPRVAAVVSQAMSRDPARRYQSVRAFLEAYRRASGESPPEGAGRTPAAQTVTPTGRSGRNPTLNRPPPRQDGGSASVATPPDPAEPARAAEPARERPGSTAEPPGERQSGEDRNVADDAGRKRGWGLFGFLRRRER